MKFSTLKSLIFLSESYVTFFRAENGTAELSKNEPIVNLEADCRGIIDKEGNLYTAKLVENPAKSSALRNFNSSMYIIHDDVTIGLKKIGDTNELDKILVQRKGDTDKFYFGESYPKEYIPKVKQDALVKSIIAKFGAKNRDKKFVQERIV